MNLIDSHNITDLVIPEQDPMQGYYYPGAVNVDERFRDIVNTLKLQAGKAISKDFTVDVEGIIFRGRTIDTLYGRHYTFRRIATKTWKLESLGLASVIENMFMDESLKMGGFVAVVGRPGQGKSTTCASVVVERMRRFGGLCLTIEDPVEVRLHGQHGEGRCLQMDVSGGREDYRQAILGSMRAYPANTQTMVYVGEIRDGFAASNLLRSALDGRLVFTTFHAADPVSAIDRLVSMAAEEIGTTEARNLMANSLRFIVHQEFKNEVNNLNQLNVSALINTYSVASNIRNGSTQMIATEMERQQIQLQRGRSLKEIMA